MDNRWRDIYRVRGIMKEFKFDKFMKDITKREQPRNDIKEVPETPQEKLVQRQRENYRHLLKWNRKK